MYCTQCGSKIDDNFKFCPECGAKTVGVEPQGAPRPESSTGYQYCPEGRPKARLSQEEVERIADEIFWNAPGAIQGDAKKLSRNAGITVEEARQMMVIRYKEWKSGKKSGKYPDTQYCPYCASQEIENFHKPGIIITRQSSAFSSMLISSQTDGVDMLKCQRCGCKWIPKKRK